MEDILISTTDRTILVWIADPAATDGGGKTGLAHTDITVSYTRVETDNDVVNSDVTSSLNALTNLTDAHNDWGWKEVSSSLAPGLYRLDLADAVFNSGAWYAVVQVTITTSLASPTPKAFRLVSRNDLDGVRLGLTALPNAAAEASGGLYTRGTGAGQINQPGNGLVDVNVENWNTTAVPAEHTAGYPIVTIKDGTGTGEINTNGGAIALVDLVTTTTTVTNLHANAATAAELAKVPKSDSNVTWNATALASIQSEVDDALVAQRLDELLNADSDIDGAAPPTVGSVFHELMTKTTGSFTYDQTTDALEAIRDRGDAAWITATGFSTHTAADVWTSGTRTLTAIDEDSTTLDLDATIRAAVGLAAANLDTQLGDLPTNAELAASFPTNFAALGISVSGHISRVTLTDTVTTYTGNTVQTGDAYSLLTSAVADSIPADGTRPSPVQALYMLIQAMTEGVISGTTWTIKKVDGSTTLFTVTLDDDTTPTSKTRSG